MAIDLSSVNKHSSATLLWSAVLFCCLGGIWLGEGIQELAREKSTYNWIVSFFFGVVFVAYGVFWAAMLKHRLTHDTTAKPASRN